MDTGFLLPLIPLAFVLVMLCIAYVYIDLIAGVWRNIRAKMPYRVYSASSIDNREVEFLNDKIFLRRIIRLLIGALMIVLVLLTLFFAAFGI